MISGILEMETISFTSEVFAIVHPSIYLQFLKIVPYQILLEILLLN